MARKSAHGCATRSWTGPLEETSGDPIDRAYLARFTLGNTALEHEVLQLFSDQLPIYLRSLTDAHTRKAWKEAAHTIKGSAFAVGAHRLARCAELAERLDVENAAALAEGHRQRAMTTVTLAAEEARGFIARLLAAA